MGLIDKLFGGSKSVQLEPKDQKEINAQPIKIIELGSEGTEIYAGYIFEEYLRNLHGRQWAKEQDKMRRSDSNVKMVLQSLKLPLKSSKWSIETKESEGMEDMAEMQKKLVQKALFEDTGMAFSKLIGEVLTFLDFGFSLFDITHQVKEDKDLGVYNTLKSVSYRSQKTIEKWNIDEFGNLVSVTQIAYGDLGTYANMDAKYLLHFAPEQEGANFEGISILRAIYGNWLRKNHFLRYIAVGIEKYAIPIPVLTVPTGKEATPEYSNALKSLKAFTGSQSNYMTIPEGWTLEVKAITFDAETIRKTIDSENQEMANSILAQFLLLGQGSSKTGSYAQSSNLSDFFKQSLSFVSNHIVEQFQRKLIDPLIKMNFGDVPSLVELKCDGLNEQADKTWSETISNLIDKGVIKADKVLEAYVRNRYNLPEADTTTTYAPPSQTPGAPPAGTPPVEPTPPPSKTLAEKKKFKARQKETVGEIDGLSEKLKEFYTFALTAYGKDLIKKIIREKDSLNSSNKIKAPMNVNAPAPSYYVAGLRYILSIATADSMADVLDLAPKKKSLSEFRLADDRTKKVDLAVQAAEDAIQELLDGDIDSGTFEEIVNRSRQIIETSELSYEQIQRVKAKVDLLVDTQVGDINKSAGLQYQSSLNSTDSDDILSQDMTESVLGVIGGPMTSTGPTIVANQVVNEGRLDGGEELGDELESYTFVAVDDDRTTDICLALDGRTFAADDPDLARYTPPLHYNCRSYLAINLAKYKDNPPINTDKLELSKKAQSQINLSEKHGKNCCDGMDEHSKKLLEMKNLDLPTK